VFKLDRVAWLECFFVVLLLVPNTVPFVRKDFIPVRFLDPVWWVVVPIALYSRVSSAEVMV